MKTKAEWMAEKQAAPQQALRPHGSQWHREEMAEVLMSAGEFLDPLDVQFQTTLGSVWALIMYFADGSETVGLNYMLARAEDTIRESVDPLTADRLLRSCSCYFSVPRGVRSAAKHFDLDVDFEGVKRGDA